MKSQNIGVIGCGWLGLPLAKKLISSGHNIKGTSTSLEKLEVLKQHGITPYLIQLSETSVLGDITSFLENTDTLVVNIPPGIRKNPSKNHVAEIRQLLKHIDKSQANNILYISSTSVYSNKYPIETITEQTDLDATTNSGKQLIEIERLLKTNLNLNTTILRFSGLIDKNRHPGQFLSGRKNIPNGNAPINLIDKNDCIAIISELIKHDIWNEELNACYPYHPTKKNYYTNYCKDHNLKYPEFKTELFSKGKIIDSSKLAQLLDFEYKTSL
ncbi:MAG: hypothetical protein ED556_03785 [Winogradskyella sp.]|uniref:NAD(P)H-binding protein n=1 Tax=Winogradskyella sp. TaxID=1883156 RepID=UPI000F3D0F90|nr:NAD(P)H-binding protein [Winogradskyella sp.]RNC88315.1 MAG: hypothetical protein ED556_03785 [Winogradskyella sp.]